MLLNTVEHFILYCKKIALSFDGAEVCELVGLYLLSQLQHLDMNVGLYREDGLAVTKLSPQNTERMKKEIFKIF